MLSLHKKKRMVLSALVVAVVILPATLFAINKLSVADNTYARTYEIPEGYTTFTDPNFYDCVVTKFIQDFILPDEEIPATGLTDEQLQRIDTLVCNSRADGEKITNVTGLEKMNRMNYLDLSSNEITSVDVSGFTALSQLDLHSNQLTSVDVSGDTVLRSLHINSNQLTSVNLTTNTNLRTLDLSSNQLTSVDLSANTRLATLYASNNQLTSLNVSSNTALTALNIDHNQLTFINLSHNASLADLISDNIIIYTGITPTKSSNNYIYDLSGLNFIEDGYHEGYIVEFSITNTSDYSYNKTTNLLTVNNPNLSDGYIQIVGVDNKDEGGFSYKFGLPFIISFDVNGGNGSFSETICYPETTAGQCTLTLPSEEPTRSGYNFLGWANSADATEAEYYAGRDAVINTNRTLYAVWELETTPVHLYYNPNGGVGEIASQTCGINVEHTSCSVTITNTVPTRDGYNFLGWANSSTATAADYQGGAAISLSADKTLYAVWGLNVQNVNLSFDLNGGDGTVATQTCTVDVIDPNCTVNIPSTTPTRNGYNFLGWADENDATSADYGQGDRVILNADKTVYAVWELVSTSVNLSFSLNGGEGAVATQTCTIDVNHPNCIVTIPNTTPSRNGYNFIGWGNSAGATSVAYNPGDNVTINSNKTLYAVWSIISTNVSLGFNLNGGDGAVDVQTCTTDVEHTTCTVTIPNTIPSKNGYTFLGWANSMEATSAAYQPGGTVTISANKTLYAVWDIITTTLTLSFDLNGAEGVLDAQTCVIDINHPTCEASVPATIPVKEDYEFLGWADSADATAANYEAGGSVEISANKTVYAVWKEIKDDDEPGDDDTPGDDEPGDDEEDDSDLPVPDTSAPDTGANTNDGNNSVAYVIVAAPILAVVLYAVVRRYNSKKSHLKFD